MTPLHSVVTWFVSSSINTALTQPASQPTPTTASTRSGYDVITGAESVFQSDRLYYDKVDAHCVINDNHHLRLRLSVLQFLCHDMDNICPYCSKNTFTNKKALKRHADSCQLKSAPPRKSSRKTSQPDPVVLNQDSDLEKVLGTSCPFTQ